MRGRLRRYGDGSGWSGGTDAVGGGLDAPRREATGQGCRCTTQRLGCREQPFLPLDGWMGSVGRWMVRMPLRWRGCASEA